MRAQDINGKDYNKARKIRLDDLDTLVGATSRLTVARLAVSRAFGDLENA
jgi:hypothetical protein